MPYGAPTVAYSSLRSRTNSSISVGQTPRINPAIRSLVSGSPVGWPTKRIASKMLRGDNAYAASSSVAGRQCAESGGDGAGAAIGVADSVEPASEYGSAPFAKSTAYAWLNSSSDKP